MNQAVSSVVNAITTAMTTYTTVIGSGIVNIFKNVFLLVDSNGTVIGLNFLGYVAVIFIGLGIVVLIICILIFKISDAYKIKALNSIQADIRMELDVEYENLLHKEQLDMWRELVFDDNDKKRREWKKTNSTYSDTLNEDIWS